MRPRAAVFVLICLLPLPLPLPLSAQAGVDELRTRRSRAMEQVTDGIILLHAASGLARWEAAGFVQDQNFAYFTGLLNAQAAILLLDGRTRESWLFVPPPAGRSPLTGLDRPFFDSGSATVAELGIDHVVAWAQFVSHVDSVLRANPTTVLYLDGGGQTAAMMGNSSTPDSLLPTANPNLLWHRAIAARWPSATIKDAFALLDGVRAIKSAAEIAHLQDAARVTAAGFWAAARAIAPGRTERQVQGAAIAGAFEAGSDGPSLWPWVRSGPNTEQLFQAMADYRNLNRTMAAGDVVRLDLGFDVAGYKGDFGRTFPVSGHFTTEQAEVLTLLSGAYQAGLHAMRPGATRHDIIQAAIDYLQAHRSQARSAAAQAAVQSAIANGIWPLHGLGMDMAEGMPATLAAGNVICFEPAMIVNGQMLFVEDMMLIMPSGYELLDPPLPYAPAELERAMRRH